mgnify:CR=1 FL=1
MKQIVAILGIAFGSLAQAQAQAHDHMDPYHLIFSQGAIHAHADWKTGPQTSGESILRVEWQSGSAHTPSEPPGPFEVSLWMPSMGHGSAPTRIQRVLDPQGQPVEGVFEVSNMYFIMGGDWQAKVTLTYPDGHKETQIIDVSLEGGGHH